MRPGAVTIAMPPITEGANGSVRSQEPVLLFHALVDSFRSSNGKISPLNACAISELCKIVLGISEKPSSGYIATALVKQGFLASKPKKTPSNWISSIERKLNNPHFIDPDDYEWSLTLRASNILKMNIDWVKLKNDSGTVSLEVHTVADSLYQTLYEIAQVHNGGLALYDLHLLCHGIQQCFDLPSDTKNLLLDFGLLYKKPDHAGSTSFKLGIHESVQNVVLSSIKIENNQLHLSNPILDFKN